MRLTIFSLIFGSLLLLSLGCSSANIRETQARSPSSSEEPLSEKNKQIVSSFFELFSAGKSAEAFALVSPHVKWWVPESLPFGGTYNREGYANTVLSQFRGFEKRLQMKVDISSLVSEGNMVAVEVESHGVHKCGNPKFVYNNKYHFKIVLENDVFVEVKEYMDTHHLAALYALIQSAECKKELLEHP